MQSRLNQLTSVRKKERELQEAETAVSASNRTLSQLQTSLNIAKQNLKSKKDELSSELLFPRESGR
jgi:DNA repair protein RAD50